jgi:hypothetical protein
LVTKWVSSGSAWIKQITHYLICIKCIIINLRVYFFYTPKKVPDNEFNFKFRLQELINGNWRLENSVIGSQRRRAAVDHKEFCSIFRLHKPVLLLDGVLSPSETNHDRQYVSVWYSVNPYVITAWQDLRIKTNKVNSSKCCLHHKLNEWKWKHSGKAKCTTRPQGSEKIKCRLGEFFFFKKKITTQLVKIFFFSWNFKMLIILLCN